MSISPDLTFTYELTVRESGSLCVGVGRGRPAPFDSEPLVGLNPRFELSAGWLKLLPARGWKRLLPLHWFSDVDRLQSNIGGKERNLSSFSLFIGEALALVLRIGDKFTFSRDLNGDYHYKLMRNMEHLLSAGTVGPIDQKGPICVWQEFDRHPITPPENLKKQFPSWAFAQYLDFPKPFVTARLMEKLFQLFDGEEAEVAPYFVYLARSNKNVTPASFEFTPRAVHAAGRLDELSRSLIVDAGHQLLSHRLRLL